MAPSVGMNGEWNLYSKDREEGKGPLIALPEGQLVVISSRPLLTSVQSKNSILPIILLITLNIQFSGHVPGSLT